MKHKQLLLVILAFLLTVVCTVFIGSSTVIGAMAGSFLSVVAAYTALDLKSIVNETGKLPAGQYKAAEKWKYFTGLALLCVLFIICAVKEFLTDINLELAYGLLGPGAIGLITIIISGMKMNKIATAKEPDKKE